MVLRPDGDVDDVLRRVRILHERRLGGRSRRGGLGRVRSGGLRGAVSDFSQPAARIPSAAMMMALFMMDLPRDYGRALAPGVPVRSRGRGVRDAQEAHAQGALGCRRWRVARRRGRPIALRRGALVWRRCPRQPGSMNRCCARVRRGRARRSPPLRDAGKRALVVLLHGFPEFWYAWRRQIGPSRTPASASSPRPARLQPLRQACQGRVLRSEATRRGRRGFIVACGEEKAFLVGHDWGAGIAWSFAMSHPEMVDRSSS